jgi:hypothetical protein
VINGIEGLNIKGKAASIKLLKQQPYDFNRDDGHCTKEKLNMWRKYVDP